MKQVFNLLVYESLLYKARKLKAFITKSSKLKT